MADDDSGSGPAVVGLPPNLASLLNVITEHSELRSWQINQHQRNSDLVTVQITFGPNLATNTNTYSSTNGRIRFHPSFGPPSLTSSGSRYGALRFQDIWRSTAGNGSTLRLYNRFGTAPEVRVTLLSVLMIA